VEKLHEVSSFLVASIRTPKTQVINES